jgi:hypothetical protein
VRQNSLVGETRHANVVITTGDRAGSIANATGERARLVCAQRVWRAIVRSSVQSTFRFSTGQSDTRTW